MDERRPFDRVRGLVGVWEGEGSGDYPTIDAFAYREVLEVGDLGPHLLQYSQRTWKLVPDGVALSHVEVGFIADVGPRVEVWSTQGADRHETLAGTVEPVAGGFRLVLTATGFLGDERMVAATRTWSLVEDRFEYEMSMATRAVEDVTLHLSAHLERRS